MIIPALLTHSKRIAEERIGLAQHMSGWLHLDILDHTLYLFESLKLEELAALDFGSLALEVHAMTEHPENILTYNLPVERLILHYELPNWQEAYDRFVAQGVDTWVAIDPNTDCAKLILPEDLGGIVLMGVEPGQTGQAFLSQTYDRLDLLKDLYPGLSVTVDGGVNQDTIRRLIAHGADNLVMGSAIFHQVDPVDAYRYYEHLSDPIGGVYDYKTARTESE